MAQSRGDSLRSADVRALSLASALGRLAIGAGMVAAPARTLRALGFSEAGSATITIGRLAGFRDLVLGAVTLTSLNRPDALRAASLANAGADGGDVIAFAIAFGGGERTAAIRGIAAALPAAIAGIWVAGRLGTGR